MNTVAPARNAFRAILTALTAGAVAAAMLVGADPAPPPAGAQTGGQIIPCPGSPYGNGWFNTASGAGYQGSVNCSQQNNHIVVDAWNSQGQLTRAVIDMWYGDACDSVSFVNGGGTAPFKIHLTNNTYGQTGATGCAIHGPAVNQNSWGTWTQGWTTTFTNTVNHCHLLQARYCGSLSGYTVARAYGISGTGPYTPIGFSGYSPCWCANRFVMDVYPMVTS